MSVLAFETYSMHCSSRPSIFFRPTGSSLPRLRSRFSSAQPVESSPPSQPSFRMKSWVRTKSPNELGRCEEVKTAKLVLSPSKTNRSPRHAALPNFITKFDSRCSEMYPHMPVASPVAASSPDVVPRARILKLSEPCMPRDLTAARASAVPIESRGLATISSGLVSSAAATPEREKEVSNRQTTAIDRIASVSLRPGFAQDRCSAGPNRNQATRVPNNPARLHILPLNGIGRRLHPLPQDDSGSGGANFTAPRPIPSLHPTIRRACSSPSRSGYSTRTRRYRLRSAAAICNPQCAVLEQLHPRSPSEPQRVTESNPPPPAAPGKTWRRAGLRDYRLDPLLPRHAWRRPAPARQREKVGRKVFAQPSPRQRRCRTSAQSQAAPVPRGPRTRPAHRCCSSSDPARLSRPPTFCSQRRFSRDGTGIPGCVDRVVSRRVQPAWLQPDRHLRGAPWPSGHTRWRIPGTIREPRADPASCWASPGYRRASSAPYGTSAARDSSESTYRAGRAQPHCPVLRRPGRTRPAAGGPRQERGEQSRCPHR